MKNYHEMAQSVLSRINEYETAKKRKKKVVLKTAVPACCLCAAVLAGVCLHGTGAWIKKDRQLFAHCDQSTV